MPSRSAAKTEKTMDLYQTIEAAIKEAMLAKDRMRLQALRGIKKEFIEARTAPGSNGGAERRRRTKNIG